LADVGLVGLPNAGKSTFLSTVSAARPKVADYPFTTLEPYLGIVNISEFRSLVMADIPGLIEGASDGKGLGITFLRHVERSKVLAFVIDINEEDPEKVYQTLLNELFHHNAALLDKPRCIIRSKIDTISEEIDDHWNSVSFKYVSMSSVTGEGVKDVLLFIDRLINESRDHH